MIIYADILIVLNLFVNYFIILATVRFLRKNVKLWKIILGSFIGAVSSLYIFLPDFSLFGELIFKILLCFLIGTVVFNIKPLKQYLKATGVLFLVTCGYAGVMIAVWKFFRPSGMAINNSVVYFNVSPLVIVIFSAIFYLAFSILIKIFGRNNIYADECDVCVYSFDKKVQFKAIVDTGNSVSDVFGKSEIIIVDKSVFESLGFQNENKTRYRAVPYSTVSGSGILDGYRCDNGIVTSGDKIIKLKSPIIAVSSTPIREDYSGIVNPQIFD